MSTVVLSKSNVPTKEMVCLFRGKYSRQNKRYIHLSMLYVNNYGTLSDICKISLSKELSRLKGLLSVNCDLWGV